ncbi:MAG TPA: MFS transporter [Patescibacteria group bacterium]|nr:MFS transporter [Patescibacteria group bacterium]
MKIHDEAYNSRKMNLISVVAFLMGFAQAVLLYVMSSYFKQASGIENVGPFYLISYTITLIIFFNLHKIIKRTGKSNAFFFSLFFKIITIVVLMNWEPSFFTIIVLMLYIILGNLEWLSMDILIESFSTDVMSGRIRGKHLTILNAGLLLGPFVSTSLLEKYDFWGVFFTLFIFNSLIFVISLFGLANVNHKFESNISARGVIKKIIKRKNIMRAYYISFALEFFYALMVIYTPLYLRDLGMSWEEIGYAFTVMLIPFVLLQYPMGILADKKFGEKEFIIIALFVMFFSTLAIFFTGSKEVIVWSMLLFFTRVGAALVEILRDSYFFKRIDSRDVDAIDFFRTAQSSAYIAASVISLIALLIFSVKIIFFIVAIVVLSALYPAFCLTDNKCEKELAIEKA